MIRTTTPSQRTPYAAIARSLPSAARTLATLTATAVLLTGCVILDLGGTSSSSGTGSSSTMGSGSATSSSGSGMETSTPPLAPLPPPSVWRVNLPVLDAEQQKRADEVEQYLAKQYQAQGWKIVETTQTFLGDILDWLDPASVPARAMGVGREARPSATSNLRRGALPARRRDLQPVHDRRPPVRIPL